MANILMVIPPERFRDEELFVTKNELEKENNVISICSTKTGLITGSRGGSIVCEELLETIEIDRFNAIVFVGGGGSKLLYNNIDAIRIARKMNSQNKIISAICLAPVILANAGLLKGKKATVAGTEAETIRRAGAEYTGPGVVVDGNIITANAPKASKLFGQKINEKLKGSEEI